MAEYLDYDGLEYYHGKLSDELSDKQTQIDANTQSISSLSSTVISHTNSISALQNGKVDKVTGKGLSTNDFTNAYKAILDGGFDYVPYELVSGGSVDLDTLLLSRSDPPKKVYYCPQTTTLIRNFPTANNQIYGAFILEVSKTSQSQTEEKVTLVQKLYFFPSTGFETITAAYGYYTRSRGWTTNPTASLTWTAWERDKAAETAVNAEQVKQDYISGSDHDYPVLASDDYSLTQGSITGTPFKMHGLKYNPKTGTLTADKFKGALIGNASTATNANYATTAGSATTAVSASKVQQTFTNGNNNRPILLSGLDNVTTTTGTSDETAYSNEFYANPSTGELHAQMFKGGINTLVDHEAHNNTNTWRKICEFSTIGHSNNSGQCALSLTLLATDGKYTSPKKGDALLRIVTHREVTSGELHHINNKLALDFTTGEFNTNNSFVCKDPSSFKLTYTVDGTEFTYKLWYHVNRAYLSTNFILLSATSSYDKKSIINEVNLSMGTLSSGATGYMNDNGVAATGVVDCEMGVIGNDIAGNAATATKLSGPQTVLYESTTATTSFTLSGLFADWSAVMIYLTGEWVSGTSGTHGFFVPLKHLKDRGAGGIADFCGNKVINFMYTDDDSMRWFEYNGPGTMTYSSVRVVGLY